MGFVARECKCAECEAVFSHGKKLSEHFKKEHNLSSEEYAIRHIHEGIKPLCPICNQVTRFVSASVGFKRYCGSCSAVAESEAGRIGGKIKRSWNKGETKETDARIATLAIKQTGSNNPFFGKHHTIETSARISMTKTLSHSTLAERIVSRCSEFELVTSMDDYASRQQQYLEFKCILCGTIQSKTLQAFERGSRCYKCFPVSKSNWELDVFSFTRFLCNDAVSGDRTVLSPKEIDIYVPSKNFGIECHGLYWHSEGSPRGTIDKHSHLEKQSRATEKSIRLLQIFQDEWRDKRTICESLIKHRLGMSHKRIGARKLKLIELDSNSRREFFETFHIAGDVPASIAWGLIDGKRVLAALSLRHPRHAQKYTDTLEVARFCTESFVNVPGGLQRLMNVASTHARRVGITNLMTYVDRRIGDGHGYEQCDFKRIGDTGVDYFYTDNFLRYDRFKFRASRNMSEAEVSRRAGVSKIYGCGSYVYIKKI